MKKLVVFTGMSGESRERGGKQSRSEGREDRKVEA